MFTAILFNSQNKKILHSTVLKESVAEVEKSLEELPERFISKRKYFQIVKITTVGSKEAEKYGVLLV